jgi:hypothetical protein
MEVSVTGTPGGTATVEAVEEECSLVTATALATGSVASMAEHVSARATVRSRSMLIAFRNRWELFSEKRKSWSGSEHDFFFTIRSVKKLIG